MYLGFGHSEVFQIPLQAYKPDLNGVSQGSPLCLVREMTCSYAASVGLAAAPVESDPVPGHVET